MFFFIENIRLQFFYVYFFIFMNEHIKHLVIYWHSKELNATEVYQKCCKHFGDDAVHYSTITDWIRKIKLGVDILTRKIGSGPSSDSTIDVQICLQLEQFPFHSLRTLSSTLKIPKSTIHDHLRKMGFVVKHLRFVPHTLNSIQKLNRVQLSKQLLKIIEQARHQSWRFFFIEDFEIQWLRHGEKPSTRSKRIISSPKRMITVFWSPLGFKIIEMLPKGCRFNSQYFTETILAKIADLYEEIDQVSPKRKLLIHMDNATPHKSNAAKSFASKNGLRFCDHPAFSPDLAASDFYLFGKVKNELKGSEFDSEDELFEAIVQILYGISREELESVMIEWENRLKTCIANGGNYVE